MTKRMLIDASHAEETRVVVLDGNRLEEFDLEAATRKPLKGNIYLAKVVRVEPSLQAAFVEYGGNRHGFLAFSEIHPDYYQIPVADRQRLLQMQAEEAREAEEAEDDPLPESPMDRAAEEDLPGHADLEAEAEDAVETLTPLAAGPEGNTGAAGGDAGPPLQAAAPEGEPPPAIASATAAESEAGAAAADAATTGPAAIEEAAPAGALLAGSPLAESPLAAEPEAPAGPLAGAADAGPAGDEPGLGDGFPASPAEALEAEGAPEGASEGAPGDTAAADAAAGEDEAAPRRAQGEHRQARRRDHRGRGRRDERGRDEEADAARADAEEEAPPEIIGGEGPEEGEGGREERRIPPRFLRHYKIQEVIKRRQIMLVQVVKEERGTKGAALTTYISLAGRFSVLMPNSPRGGGVSRKITSAADRKRLREAIDELSLPDGMSLIVRTAGAQRPKPEIKKDCEYLLRLWDNIRERTLASTAPALIYEEADLIKRSIRDVFSRDVEEIVIEGEDAYQEARDFMRMLMPQHVKKVQYAREGGLFARAQVEQQLDAMHSPTVQMKSGGYIVINQTEALVAIDVNSGRSTRERHIEDTALRTNLEAADEIARQLRLRDLAGLIVIDFIDMESSKHDGMVERRLKEALRFDRARIQVGRISHFGLLEMSRQRLRPSLAETSFVTCPHCQGRGTVRSIESSALSVLRAIEEEGAKRRSAEIAVHCCSTVALYLLNRKRDRLTQIEEHFGMAVLFEPDESLSGPQHRIERLRAAEPAAHRALPAAPQAALRMDYAPEPEEAEEDEAEEGLEDGAEAGADEEAEPAVAREGETQDEAEARVAAEGGKRRRRRRRRRGGPRPEGAPGSEAAAGAEEQGEDGSEEEGEEAEGDTPLLAATGAAEAPGRDEAQPSPEAAEGRGPRRRRGRRRGEGTAGEAAAEQPRPAPRHAPMPPAPPRYVGPTPADPFAGHVDDILAAMEAAEAAAEAAAANRIGRMQPAAEPAAPAPAAAEPPLPEAMAQDLVTPEPVAPAVEVTETRIAEAPVAGTQAAGDAAPAPEAAPEAAPAPEAITAAAPAPAPVPAGEPAGEPPLANGRAGNGAAPEAATAAEPPVQGPQIAPKVIGEAPTEAPRRAGWWRR